MALVLGLDVGTQGAKGLVLDGERGVVVARASVAYGLIEGLCPGAAEQHPRTWSDAVRALCRELAQRTDLSDIEAVGVSGQQHGLVVLDAAGEVVRPAKLWCDTSTTIEARELSAQLGRAVPVGYTAPKVTWLARHEPESWARTTRVMLPHDYVNWWLTGEHVTEAGDASGTGWFDVRTRSYDRSAVEVVDPDLGHKLPRLLAADEPAGCVTDSAARELGLPAGALVSAGGGDNMLAAIGSGATRPGVVVVSLGTSGTAFTYSPAAVVDPEGLVAEFCDSTGGWLPLVCVMNLTGVLEEVCASTGKRHAELSAAAQGVAIGADGLLWLPYLAGERVPDLPEATGTLLGMRAGALRPDRLYRAALEGVTLNLGWGIERLRALGRASDERARSAAFDQLRLVGGGAGNSLWRRILADVLDCPVVALEEPESAALGAALQALWCLRTQAGERATIDEVAAPFVRTAGEATEPSASGVEAYARLATRFRSAVGEFYEGAPGRTPS